MRRESLRSPLGVLLMLDSSDAKLVRSTRSPTAFLRCAATYRPIRGTCRKEDCALHPELPGPRMRCYVNKGNVAFTNRRLEDLAKASGASPLALTRAEAALISGFATIVDRPIALDLRLGVSGEVSGPKGARALAHAAERWSRRVGGRVWSYTHAWRRILRKSFGAASVLASVDSGAEIAAAKRRGYVPAYVLHGEHQGTAPFTVKDDPTGTRFIRCPNETMGMACVECRLCLNDVKLKARGMGIAFATKKTKRHLPLLGVT